jgi:tRNA pseudouridine38-40 synthase
MPVYRITLAYDGGGFQGWQRQAGAARTVQGVVEDALRRLAGGAAVTVAAAGRTDAGVHAIGQVASFELPRDMAPAAVQAALNGLLPADVRALEAAFAPPGFHPRRSAVAKLYRYVLDTGPVRLPTRRLLAGHVPWSLNLGAMEEAAALYLGRHDFASLASSGSSVKTTVRTVLRSTVTAIEPSRDEGGRDPVWGIPDGQPLSTLVYEVEADGFLRKMVRSMVGGLVAVGRGTLTVDGLRAALLRRDRRAWPAPLEPCGLTLVRVSYPPGRVLE